MRSKFLVGMAAVVSLVALAACDDRNTTVAERNGDKVATAPAQPGATGPSSTVTAPPANTGKAELDSGTREYVQNAAMGDLFEVEASRLALQRARSPEVKQLAQMMVDAHTMSSDELKSRLVRAGVIVEAPTTLDGEHRDKIEQLRGANNQQFDARYLAEQKEAHDDALMLHRDYAMSGTMADLKAFAADMVPKVEMHRMMIADLESNVGKGKLSKN